MTPLPHDRPDPRAPAAGRRHPHPLWRLTAAAIAAPDANRVAQQCAAAGACRFLVDWHLGDAELRDFAQTLAMVRISPIFILGLHADQLSSAAATTVEQRLEALASERCEAAVIQGASISAIKSGGPFHRMMQLREQGLIGACWTQAEDAPSAEWMAQHTPAHGLVAPFGLADLSAGHRALSLAREAGMDAFAAPAGRAAWRPPADLSDELNLSFLAAESDLAGVIVDLPARALDMDRVISALANPLPPAQRAWWWAQFVAAVPAPPPMERGLPPDML